ncbi:MAG TPA: hypothetical protein PLV64_13680 [Anaerolineales bacterium]|nr:hypothetical protein [Anaerolineales bacterium]
MEFFFPEDNLTRTVPEETRITVLTAEPYPDGRRLRVNLNVTPFQKRPYIEITLTNAQNEEIATTSIVEPLSWNLELTMHIRGEHHSPYTLTARLYYPEGPTAEPVQYVLDVNPPQPDPRPDTP